MVYIYIKSIYLSTFYLNIFIKYVNYFNIATEAQSTQRFKKKILNVFLNLFYFISLCTLFLYEKFLSLFLKKVKL